jgi:threonine dehydrogenase-like Zn-dependent dehydrogenase
VIASDFSPGRRGIAERFGADVVVDPDSASPYEKWADLAGPPLPSSPLIETSQQPNTVVFECVGIPGILQIVINSVVPHTRIIVVGVCMQPDTITPAAATTKEVSVTFVFAYRPDEFTQALRWIADGTVDAGAFVSAVRSFEDAPDAFAQLRRPDEHCKILLTPGGSQ